MPLSTVYLLEGDQGISVRPVHLVILQAGCSLDSQN